MHKIIQGPPHLKHLRHILILSQTTGVGLGLTTNYSPARVVDRSEGIDHFLSDRITICISSKQAVPGLLCFPRVRHLHPMKLEVEVVTGGGGT